MKLLVSTFFCLGFMFGCSQDSTKGWTVYKSNAYQVQCPLSWTIDTSKKMGLDVIFLSSRENDTDKFLENVNVLIQDLTGMGIDLDKFASVSEDQIKTLATDGVIYESKRIKKNGSLYHKFIFTATQGIFRFKYEQYCYLVNNKAFVITLTTEVDKFEAFKEVGERILNSFMLIE